MQQSHLRIRSVAPLLTRHIAYNPFPNMEDTRIRPLGMVYPAYGALEGIGIPAIPHLLAELKKTAPKKGEESLDKHELIIFCICDIYDQGVSKAFKARLGWWYHGKMMAKKRLEVELATTKDEKEKANFQAALDAPIFKENAIQMAENIAKAREKLEAKLIAIVQSPGTDAKTLERQKKAVELLGKIGTEKSVPILLSVLYKSFNPTHDGVEFYDHDGLGNIPPTPAMKALASLGPLAVEPLVDDLIQSQGYNPITHQTWQAYNPIVQQTLGMLPCEELVAAVLEYQIRRAKTPRLRDQLESTYILVVDEALQKAGGEKEKKVGAEKHKKAAKKK